MTRVAFVSFANIPFYQALQKELVFSVKRFGYDIYTYSKFEDIGSPTHQQSPYEFKMHSIRTVYMKGYDIVIWCDSPARLLRSISSWIPEIEKRGVYLQEDGHPLGSWANDRALEAFGMSRDDAMKLKTVYASIMAFDFRHPITKQFLYRWKDCADKGLFKGKWKNDEFTESKDPRCEGHRHDQTCAELVANEMGIKTAPRVITFEPNPIRYFKSHWHT
jgi:hypothetical protein